MLRLIIWTATIWFVLVFFTGCAQQQGNGMSNQNRSDATWAKPNSKQIIEAEKAKTPPITATTYYTAGLLLENQGDYAGAAEKFNRALDADHSSVAAYNHLGICYIRLRNYPLAEDAFKQALQQAPNLAHIHNNLGFVFLLENKFSSAEAELRNAIAIDPRFRRAHSNLGVALAKQGKDKEALEHFQQSCSPCEAYYNLALILHSQRKWDKAEENYKLALQNDPKFEPASKGLTQLKQDLAPKGTKVTLSDD